MALDLKEIALAVRDEQSTTTELLQAIHAVVDNHVATVAPAPAVQPYYPSAPAQYAQPPQYQAPYQPQYQPEYQQSAPAGGALHRFLGGRFGQAIVTGAGIGSVTTSSTASSTASEPQRCSAGEDLVLSAGQLVDEPIDEAVQRRPTDRPMTNFVNPASR